MSLAVFKTVAALNRAGWVRFLPPPLSIVTRTRDGMVIRASRIRMRSVSASEASLLVWIRAHVFLYRSAPRDEASAAYGYDDSPLTSARRFSAIVAKFAMCFPAKILTIFLVTGRMSGCSQYGR